MKSKTKVIYYLLSKLRQEVLWFLSDKDSSWKMDSNALAILAWSYAQFWEIVAQNTKVIGELREAGIPCREEMKNNYAHCCPTKDDKNDLVAYAEGICGDKMAVLILENLQGELDVVFTDTKSVMDTGNTESIM